MPRDKDSEEFFRGFVPLEIDHAAIQQEAANKPHSVYLFRSDSVTRGWMAYMSGDHARNSTMTVRVYAKDGAQAKNRAITWIRKIVSDPDKYMHEWGNILSINPNASDIFNYTEYPELKFLTRVFS